MASECDLIYAKKQLDSLDSETLTFNESGEIAKFFAGRKVLVTGGTGFIGKLIIEKLLRSCPEIKTVYMLIREKKKQSVEDRYKEHFDDVIYSVLRKSQPNFLDKVVMIEGNTALDDIGLSPENKKLLLDTEIVFHGAATVRFDETLRSATQINVKGTKQVVLLAKQMPNLKAFVHISTAFSNCTKKLIEEKFYDPPMSTENLLSLLDILDDEKLQKITPTILGEFPNTYAFTKAIGEDTVRQYSTDMPTCIVRPSICIATANEPIVGWINNLYGPTGVMVGAGLGLLRTLHCIPENVADIIPADYVVNTIIAAAWDTAVVQRIPPSITNSDSTPEKSNADVIPIYNVVSSCQNPINWREFHYLNELHGVKVPSALSFWYCSLTLNRYLFIHNIFLVFMHYIPAAIVDMLAIITGRKPMLLDAYKKIHKFSAVIAYFTTQQWRFKNDTVLKLNDKMSPNDRKTFNIDLKTLNWPYFFYYHVRALRIYMLKDPVETIPAAQIKYRKLKIAHYTLFTIFWLLVAYCVYSFIKYVFL